MRRFLAWYPALMIVAAAVAILVSRPEGRAAPPEATPVAGAATITVKARLTDGSKPQSAECLIHPSSPQNQPPLYASADDGHPVPPTVVGKDGDWVITNVGPGPWVVEVRRDDLAWDRAANQQSLQFKAGEKRALSFTLTHGGAIAGRVLSAGTGQPLKGAIVGGSDWDRCKATTDAHGRYTVQHLASGRQSVRAEAEGCVPMQSKSADVKDGATVEVPDLKLPRGG